MIFLKKIYNVLLSYITLFKYKLIYGDKFVFSWSDRLDKSVKIRINGNGKLILGKRVGIRSEVIFNITNGRIYIGDDVFFNDFCCLNARKNIIIKNGNIIGQSVKMYDHDHDYKKNFREDFIVDDIMVDTNCWIGSDSILLKGTKIGKNCVIGAASIVKGEIRDNIVFINKRSKEEIAIHNKN